MSEFDPQILGEIRTLLDVLPELSERRVAALQSENAPGSLLAADANLPDARFVVIFAGQAMFTAIDHLVAWRLLTSGHEIPVAAHLTLLRGALESAVRCRWHVDASVDGGTRVGRAIATRRADQEERRKFEASHAERPRAMGPRSRTAVQRLAQIDDPRLAAARKAAGVRSVGFTDTTALMAQYGYEAWFRLTSGLAHSKEWAKVATKIERATRFSSGVMGGRFSASEPVALALTKVTVEATGLALVDLEAYVAGG